MYGKVYSAGRRGMEGFLVEVETDISEGLPCMELVGALGGEVKEARERVKAALHHCGVSLPPKRITVNLSPAGRRKEGGGFDLPVAAAILGALGKLPGSERTPSHSSGASRSLWDDTLLLGELGLDGTLKPVNGILPLTHFAREQGFSYCLMAKENAPEGCLVKGIQILAISHLSELWELVKEPARFVCRYSLGESREEKSSRKDFADIFGQEALKRAAEVAAAGMHNLLIVGPPGAGKTMAAERIPGILPELSWEEKLEITKIYSICGRLKREAPLVEERPFRALHHTVPAAALMGGGRVPEPGEISLAHQGVLFLDELPEFPRRVLETLRQPMEEREVVISRVYGAYRFPANFVFVAGMNACPCGHFPDREQCHCTEAEIHRYQSRLSRPLLERIDICTEVKKLSYEEVSGAGKGESSASIRERVEKACRIQKHRYRNEGFRFNSAIPAGRIAEFCPLEEEARKRLEKVYEVKRLSARTYHKILKVARTIADLEGAEVIGKSHISEAVSYRERSWEAGE